MSCFLSGQISAGVCARTEIIAIAAKITATTTTATMIFFFIYDTCSFSTFYDFASHELMMTYFKDIFKDYENIRDGSTFSPGQDFLSAA